MNRSVIDWPTGVTVYHPDRCYNGYTLVHGRGPWDPVRGISAQHIPEHCYRRCTAPPEWEHAKSGYGQGTDLRSDLGR